MNKPLAKIKLKKQELRCVWRNSSTGKKSGVGERPRMCRERNCSGIFRDKKPECEDFIRDLDLSLLKEGKR